MGGAAGIDHATRRALAVELFNRTWALLDQHERTSVDVAEMIHSAHASCALWAQVGMPANVARGEWQCTRVYATLGRPEPALWHARRCLELAEAGGEGFEDWDLPSARQAMAHAQLAAGELEEAKRWAALAQQAAAKIEDPEDREHIERQIAELGLEP
jgi:hypothetical protein